MHWLGRAQLLWLTLGVSALGLWIVFRTGGTEQQVRLAGMCLQLGGIATVAVGLRDTRRMFKKPSYWELLRDWLKAFPPWHGDVIAAAGSAVSLGLTGKARGSVWAQPLPGDSLDKQIEAIARNVATVRDDLHALRREFDKHESQTAAAISQESKQRANALRELDDRLERAHTGGIYVSAVGLIWLSMGVIYTSIPAELIALGKAIR